MRKVMDINNNRKQENFDKRKDITEDKKHLFKKIKFR